MLEKTGSETGLTGGFIFVGVVRGTRGSRESRDVVGEGCNGEGGVGGAVVGVPRVRVAWQGV